MTPVMDPAEPSMECLIDEISVCLSETYNSTINSTASVIDLKVPLPFVLWQTILIAIGCILCILLTIGGNLLVLMSFFVERAIRQPSNYFIASLAATDVFIGSVSMPFFTIYVLMGEWTLGPILCDLWLSVDHTVCLVSQYTVLLITIDRFCSVKIAARYRGWRSRSKVLFMIAMTWVIPALLFFISIFGWEHFVGTRKMLENECKVQFLQNPIFSTALIVTYYWVTLVVLIILYAGIYKTAYDMQKKSEAKHHKMKTLVALSAGGMAGMAGRTAGLGISKNQSTKQDKSNRKPSQVPSSTQGTQINSQKHLKGTFIQPVSEIGDDSSCKKSTGTSKSASFSDGKDIEKFERSSSPMFDSDEESSQTNASKRFTIAQLLPKMLPPPVPPRKTPTSEVLPKIPEQIKIESDEVDDTDMSSGINKTSVYKKTSLAPAVPPRSDKSLAKLCHQISAPAGGAPVSSSITSSKTSPTRAQSQSVQCKKKQPLHPTSLPLKQTVNFPITPLASSTPTNSLQSTSNVTNNITDSHKSSATSNLSPLNLTGQVSFDVVTGLDIAALRHMDEISFSLPPSIVAPKIHNPSSPTNVSSSSLTTRCSHKQIGVLQSKSEDGSELSLDDGSDDLIDDKDNVTNILMTSVVNACAAVTNISDNVTSPVSPNYASTTSMSSVIHVKSNTRIAPDNSTNMSSSATEESSEVRSDDKGSSTSSTSQAQNRLIAIHNMSSNKTTTTVARVESSPLFDRDKTNCGPGTASDAESSINTSSKKSFVKSLQSLKKKKKKRKTAGEKRLRSKSENRANKALRTISVILGAFVFCWTPYHTIAIAEGWCKCTNIHLYMFSYFLCYANSPINPFCYALANQQFKKTFMRILRGDFHVT